MYLFLKNQIIDGFFFHFHRRMKNHYPKKKNIIQKIHTQYQNRNNSWGTCTQWSNRLSVDLFDTFLFNTELKKKKILHVFPFYLGGIRFATKKASGTSKNGRDSAGRRLGLKKWPGEHAEPNNIIIRQRGTKWLPGQNVGVGKDHTIYALVSGRVYFTRKKLRHKSRTWCNILDDRNQLVTTPSGEKIQIECKWSEEEVEQLKKAVAKWGGRLAICC